MSLPPTQACCLLKLPNSQEALIRYMFPKIKKHTEVPAKPWLPKGEHHKHTHTPRTYKRYWSQAWPPGLHPSQVFSLSDLSSLCYPSPKTTPQSHPPKHGLLTTFRFNFYQSFLPFSEARCLLLCPSHILIPFFFQGGQEKPTQFLFLPVYSSQQLSGLRLSSELRCQERIQTQISSILLHVEGQKRN